MDAFLRPSAGQVTVSVEVSLELVDECLPVNDVDHTSVIGYVTIGDTDMIAQAREYIQRDLQRGVRAFPWKQGSFSFGDTACGGVSCICHNVLRLAAQDCVLILGGHYDPWTFVQGTDAVQSFGEVQRQLLFFCGGVLALYMGSESVIGDGEDSLNPAGQSEGSDVGISFDAGGEVGST